MKKIALCIIAVMALAFTVGLKEQTCCSIGKEEDSAIEKAILQTHDKIIAAAEEQDIDKMFSYILDNDKGAIIQDGKMMTRQQAMDVIKQGSAGVKSIKYNFQQRQVKILCPTIAILTGTGTVTTVIESGETFTSEFANSSVFILQDKEWKIIHGHHSIPNPR